MKKIVFIICVLIIFANDVLAAVTMCAKQDVYAVALDPTINGTSYTSNASAATWTTTFPYGTISGISACLSSNNDKSMGGTVSKLTDKDQRVVGGEKNGQYCWCKMTHPAVSLWVFNYLSDPCSSYCTGRCASDARSSPALRVGLFGSVGN